MYPGTLYYTKGTDLHTYIGNYKTASSCDGRVEALEVWRGCSGIAEYFPDMSK